MRNLIAILEEKQTQAYQDWEKTRGWEKTKSGFFLGRYIGLAEAKQALIDELDQKEEEEEAKVN